MLAGDKKPKQLGTQFSSLIGWLPVRLGDTQDCDCHQTRAERQRESNKFLLPLFAKSSGRQIGRGRRKKRRKKKERGEKRERMKQRQVSREPKGN